jgi:protein tyrosine phosphatase (PTP) superfamily phosphohydrolase (DUF442 family)
MLNLHPMRTGGQAGGMPPRARGKPPAPRLALLLLALACTVAFEGCASLRGGGGGGDPCGTPGGCGGGGLFGRCNLFKGRGIRNPFRRDVIVTDPCATGVGVPLEGAPVVTPGTIIESPAPASADPLPQLEPAPTTLQSAPAATGQSSPNKKTLYETMKPADAAASSASARRGGAASGDDPLVNLPPLSATSPPADDTPPVAPAAESVKLPAPLASAATTPTAATAPAELPPRPVPQPISAAPGIARFKVVEPQLAGGSLPAAPGWSFLADKGYRTVLDLRPRAEAQPGDDAAAAHAGLRYVLLPVTAETLDEILVKRFNEELALSESRPLFFFDADGSRAAVLWYLHQVAVDGVDEATARREVEELGPRDESLWAAAGAFLRKRKEKEAAATSTPAPTPAATPILEPVPTTPAAPPAPVAAPASVESPLPTTPAPETAALLPPPARGPIRTLPPVAPQDATPRDPTAWRPYAALLVTSLSIPLAYIGRSAISTAATRMASLPAPRPRAQLPRPASDE